MMGLICKMLVTVMNRVHWKIEKFTVVTILSVDFVLMLYNMGFKYSSQMDSLDFWICSLRSIANGSLILIILPRCFNDHSTSEYDSKEYPHSKFRYTHNEVNLLSRWTYSWI